MRILDADDNELEESEVDLDAGRLVSDAVVSKHHDATDAKSEQGHLEWSRFYFADGSSYEVTSQDDPHVGPDGWVPVSDGDPREAFGADQRWVVDEQQVDAADEYDEYEDVLRYVQYTGEELARIKEHKEREEFVSSGSSRLSDAESALADSDEAVCSLYESLLASQKVADEQDEAICSLYEMIGGDK